MKYIFHNLRDNLLLKIIKYNKYLQKRLNKDLKDFINHQEITIEIIPINEDERNIIINYVEEGEKFYKIYFNDEKEEKKEIIYIKVEMFQK